MNLMWTDHHFGLAQHHIDAGGRVEISLGAGNGLYIEFFSREGGCLASTMVRKYPGYRVGMETDARLPAGEYAPTSAALVVKCQQVAEEIFLRCSWPEYFMPETRSKLLDALGWGFAEYIRLRDRGLVGPRP